MKQPKPDRTSPAITILSAAGLIICLYLTAVYYITDGAGTYCGARWSCDEVLGSKFSKLFGYPASLAGAIGYAFLLAAVIRGGIRQNRAVIIGVASAAAGFSAYLSWAEFFVIQKICPFCVASAAIVFAIWILSVRGARVSQIAAGILIGVFAAAGGYASAALSDDPASRVSAPSFEHEKFQKNLAAHLKESGAVMYGSFKCPACLLQKKYFGRYAEEVNYVECHPEGKNANPQLCSDRKISAFPTWEIDGSLYKGVQTLKKLADMSGYKGYKNQ